jgi:hypothetical protein
LAKRLEIFCPDLVNPRPLLRGARLMDSWSVFFTIDASS